MAHNGRRLFALLLLLLLPLTAQATPEIQSWTTAKGAKVMYVHVPDLPMVDVRMVFDAGSARDDGKPGIASLTNTLLNDGAGEWNANQLAERFENIGARFTTGSLRDMAIVSLRTLTDDEEVLSQGLDTITAVVTRPQFDEKEIDRRRQQVLVSLEQQKQDAGTVASHAFYETLYGDHPYAHNPSGNPISVAAITVEDIRNYFKKYYVASNLVVAIVGAVDRAQAGKLVEQITSEMPVGSKAAPLPRVTFSKGESISIDFPSTQTHIYLGQPGMSRSDPDYLPLYVGNHMFGGSGLVSILSEEVRENRGLSYSVYSYFTPMRGAGPFMMVAQTRNERAEEALGVMRQQLADFIKNGPSEERLVQSKKNISGGFPLRVSSNSKIVEYIAMIGFYDYPLDYLATFVGKVEAVTAEQIHSAFKRRIHPDNLATILVGNSSENTGPVEKQE